MDKCRYRMQGDDKCGEDMNSFNRSRCETTVRVRTGAWGGEADCAPEFKHIVTLDPAGTEEAWTKLSTFTPAVELRELSWRLHVALRKAITDSESLRQLKAVDINSSVKPDAILERLRHAGM